MPHTLAHTPGDRVRVIDGPFATYEAVVRAVDVYHLKLDVAAAGITIPITVHPNQVERVG